jgi:hypothetical protein
MKAIPMKQRGRDVYATHLSLIFVLLFINYLFTISIIKKKKKKLFTIVLVSGVTNLIQHIGKNAGANTL